MEKRDKEEMSCRKFLKIVGVSVVVLVVVLYGCVFEGKLVLFEVFVLGEVFVDKMMYCVFFKGECVLFLGYGCMCWLLKFVLDSDGNVID